MTGPVPPLSGFTLVRNAERLDFPVVQSIRSLLPLCDEVVVNVGASDDHTLELVRGVGDPKVRILETEWDFTDGRTLLRRETLRAMRACRHPWGIYIQADEVLHEDGLQAIREAVRAAHPDPGIEGLVLRYRHFYGSPFTESVNRQWYRREVRVVRMDTRLGIEPYRDAQGFRVDPGGGGRPRRVRCRLVNAEMCHYGWTRSAAALRDRAAVDRQLYQEATGVPVIQDTVLPWMPGLRPFRGTHPAVARGWVEAHAADPHRSVAPARFRLAHLRLHASGLLERLTGLRPFEFRNYRLV